MKAIQTNFRTAKIDATGMAVFQRIMETAKAADDIWIGTRSQAAAHLRATLRM